MKYLFYFIGGALALFAILAAFSRVAKMPESPEYIKNASRALANLFNGAFGL